MVLYSYASCSQHIEGAVKFSVDAVADKSSDLPRALPPLEQFEDHIGKVMQTTTMRMPPNKKNIFILISSLALAVLIM